MYLTQLNPPGSWTAADRLREGDRFWQTAIEGALTARGVQRSVYERKGFVVFALPPVQNRRSSSQQGAFLLSGAEGITFQESLSKMMVDQRGEWCKCFSIPDEVTQEFEENLFQMNIHDLSLFSDLEGLAGFIRQKIRLHWLMPE